MGEDLGTRLLSKHKRAVGREFAGYPGPYVLFECASQGPPFPVAILRFGVGWSCCALQDPIIASELCGLNQCILAGTGYAASRSMRTRQANRHAVLPDHATTIMPRLDHVGIATTDTDRILEVLRDLLAESCYLSETLERDGIHVSFVSSGTAQLELLEALDETSPVARFLRKRGDGLHHLAFEVEDIDDTYRRAREAGYEPIDPAPRPGAGGKTIFFLHPGQTSNILIEFCTRAEPSLEPVKGALPEGIQRVSLASASPTQTPCLYVTASSSPSPDPHQLVRRLTPDRVCMIAQIEPGASPDITALIDMLGAPSVHLLAQGVSAKTVLHTAQTDSRIHAIILTDPGPDEVETLRKIRDIPKGLLVITADSETGLRTATGLRARHTVAIAAVTDPRLRMALIEQHLATQSDPA